MAGVQTGLALAQEIVALIEASNATQLERVAAIDAVRAVMPVAALTASLTG